jgi:hypothetical protein
MKVHPDIVGIGASSGGIEALQRKDFPISMPSFWWCRTARPIVSAICVISLCETSTCRWYRGTGSCYITASATSASLRAI